MKVDESPVGRPPVNGLMDTLIIRSLTHFQPILELVLAAYIIRGIHIQPSQATKHYVLSRPTPNAIYATKSAYGAVIVHLLKGIEVKLTFDHGAGYG